MKKIILIVCLFVSYFSFSSFGFIDNPKAVHAKTGRNTKIKSQSEIQKIVVQNINLEELPNQENPEMNEEELSFLSKIINSIKLVVKTVYTLMSR